MNAEQSDTPKSGVTILGIFVADLAFHAQRLPGIGETIAGSGFKLGPGGKGSNQAVAAARAGAATTFISALGTDDFATIARTTWQADNIYPVIRECPDQPTGAAFIYVNDATGENAIIVVPGAAASISPADVDAAADHIGKARVFITQLEQPVAAALHGLQRARSAGTITIFNPAPVEPVPDELFPHCDFITPNETEAEGLTGTKVTDRASAEKAAAMLLDKGVGTALITLGENGALFHDGTTCKLVPAFDAGKVQETAGAGDAFNGGFAAALDQGMAPLEAVRFGCATAGISVTRHGTAPAMPRRQEIIDLLNASA